MNRQIHPAESLPLTLSESPAAPNKKATTRRRLKLFWAITLLLLAGVAMAETPAPISPISLPELLNVKYPAPGLVTGGQPTVEDLERAATLGFGLIINLRATSEEAPFDESATVEALGMEYVAIPIAGKANLSATAAEQLAVAMGRAQGRPVLLHCASGNRVGALLALKAFHVDGLSAEQAMEVGERSGLTSLALAVEALLSNEPAAESSSPTR